MKYRSRVLEDKLLKDLDKKCKSINPYSYGLPIENGISKEFNDIVYQYYLDKKRAEESNLINGFYDWFKKMGYTDLKRDDLEEYLGSLK